MCQHTFLNSFSLGDFFPQNLNQAVKSWMASPIHWITQAFSLPLTTSKTNPLIDFPMPGTSLALRSGMLKATGALRARHPGYMDSCSALQRSWDWMEPWGQHPCWLGWLIPIVKAQERRESRGSPNKASLGGSWPPLSSPHILIRPL